MTQFWIRCGLILSFFACSTVKQNGREIVVLGDSLSDTGRLHAHTMGIFYPEKAYWHARASNGPIWIDEVANALHRPVLNYAVAGAATRDFSWWLSFFIPSLSEQVDTFLSESRQSERQQQLVVIWIGPNNYMKEPENADVPAAIQDVEHAILRLQAAGVKHLIVGTMPELSGLPLYNKPSGQVRDRLLRDITRAHNHALMQLLPRLQFAVFRAFDINQRTVQNPREFGFRNIKDACYGGDLRGKFEGPEVYCADPSGYKFWDEVHPSTRMHSFYARQFLEDLQAVGWSVPKP